MNKFCLIICCAVSVFLSATAQINTRIDVSIVGDKPTGTMYFGEFDQDFRVKPPQVIRYADGKFSHEFTAPDTIAYSFCFEDELLSGSWAVYTVFSEGGVVDLTIYPADNTMVVARGEITKQYQSLLDPLQAVSREQDMLETESEALDKKAEQLYAEYQAKTDSIIADTPSVLGLFFLFNKIAASARSGYDPELKQELDRYETVYPNHPLAEKSRTMLIAQLLKDHGGSIPDLTVAAIDGNEHHVKDLLNDQYTVLDLWASWCGPCRRHSIELIPVYNEYKEKGLSIIAVARESGDTSRMLKAMEKDGYPWPSYVDLNDQFGVWDKMGVGNAGGAIFLLDSQGHIIKTNPTTDEIKALLTTALK